MRTPSGHDQAADRRATYQAWLAGPHIHAMLKLEKTADPGGIHVVGHGRTAERDSRAQHSLQAGVKPGKFSAGEPGRPAAGSEAGSEKTLVCIDVADAVQQLLIEQGGLDGRLPAPKEGLKVRQTDVQRLNAGACKAGPLRRLDSGN